MAHGRKLGPRLQFFGVADSLGLLGSIQAMAESKERRGEMTKQPQWVKCSERMKKVLRHIYMYVKHIGEFPNPIAESGLDTSGS